MSSDATENDEACLCSNEALVHFVSFHRLYRFTSSRRLTELLMSDKGGCTSHYPGVGQIEYVKDLLAGEIVTRNFQCSRFGPAYPPGLGWVSNSRMIYPLPTTFFNLSLLQN